MRLNDLSGKAWIKFSKSVWITQKLLAWSGRVPLQRTSTFLIKKQPNKHKIMNDRLLDESRVKLIELFTQKGQQVFDPYLHDGDTMRAALSVDREFIGIGETPAQCDVVRKQLDFHLKERKGTLFNWEDNPNALNEIQAGSIDFLLSEMPLFDFKHQANHYQSRLEALGEKIKAYTKN